MAISLDEVNNGLGKRKGISLDEVNAQFAKPETFDPTEGMSRTDKFLAGAGKGMTDLARGAGQMLGMVSDADIAESRKRDAALMNSGYAQAGNIVGQAAALAPAALIPGANTYVGASLIGAGAGAARPHHPVRVLLRPLGQPV